MRTNVSLFAICAFVLCACPPPVDPCTEDDSCDAGSLPPDFCNSQEEGESDTANCHLTVTTGGAALQRKEGVFLSRLADGGADQDWYFAQLPTLTERSLLHINGGYTAPQTAVNFTLSVLKPGTSGLMAIAAGVDAHGASAPKPVDLILPFSESNAKLWILASDQPTGGVVHVDNRNPYTLGIEVLENPDLNEPNDTTATELPFASMGGVSTATAQGYLATNDDLDLYAFTVPSGARQIVYLHITETGEHPTNPPPPYRLAYTLFDPAHVPVAEGWMDNNTLPIDLATARLATAGAYSLEIRGYKDPQNPETIISGDLRVQYLVTLQLLPDIDSNEPNDTTATAKTVTISPNGRTTVTGKLSYVADEEWFTINLSARGSPSTLRYRLTALDSGGRFAPLTSTPGRELRFHRTVTTGATTEDRRVNCKTDPVACPHSEDDDGTVDDICEASEPPLCLYSQREEENPRMANLHNFVGAMPIPAGGANQITVSFRDQGKGLAKYADDRDWRLELEWFDDGDEAGRAGGPSVSTLGTAASTVNGELTFGYGRELDNEWNRTTDGIRGLNDYDAYPTDTDLFQFNVSGTGEQSWNIEWELGKNDGGTNPPGSIAFDFTFCTAAGSQPDGGLCLGQQRRIYAYNPAPSLTPWYLSQSASNGRMLFSRTDTMTSTTFTVTPPTCACLSAPRVASGVIFANITGVHRLSNDPIRYRITQSLETYPGAGFTVDGGAASCPVVDAGCGFIR